MAAKLGSGERFKAVEASVKGPASEKAAVAAIAGRKKYGDEKFSAMARAGKKKHHRSHGRSSGR